MPPGDEVRLHAKAETLAGAAAAADRPGFSLATHAQDIDKVKDAVVDSANTARNTWVLFLSFGTYLAVAVGSVTHRHLLLEEPIRLPLLSVELPLRAFFFVAPLLFLIFHVYLLMHLKLMSDKVWYYNNVVRGLGLDRTTEGRLRLQLPDFMFVQYLAGPDEGCKSLMHWLLVLVALLTVIIGPVGLLVLVQLQYLPYHGWITWVHRVIIVLDVILLCCFWPKISLANGGNFRFSSARRRLVLSGLITFSVFVFSVFIAVYPGERLHGIRGFAYLTKWLFDEGPIDLVTFWKSTSANWLKRQVGLGNERRAIDDMQRANVTRKLSRCVSRGSTSFCS